jgi:hypothetical protein
VLNEKVEQLLAVDQRVRISAQADHSFRSKLITRFGPS